MKTEKTRQTDFPFVHVIGFGVSPSDLTRKHLDLIERADVLIGAARHLAHFADLPAEKIYLDGKLSRLAAMIKAQPTDRRIVVIASGDPLFYGIGGYLVSVLGPERVEILPNITTVAGAFARIKTPWQDARIISLHGRNNTDDLLDAVSGSSDVAVLTSPENNPAWIAAFLVARDRTNLSMCVLSRLGTPEEKIEWLDLPVAAGCVFPEPNLVILRRKKKPKLSDVFLGMPDEGFEHENGLITKSEIRAVTLSKLQLRSYHVLWDLGAGSGAVAVEAASIVTSGRLVAVEKEARRIKLIHENKRRFGLERLEIVHATLPEGLSTLPEPDRIFIGGGGKDLEQIIRSAVSHLKPGGRIVINTVLLANVETAATTLKALGFDSEIVQVQVSRSRSMPFSWRFEPLNPVWIVCGS